MQPWLIYFLYLIIFEILVIVAKSVIEIGYDVMQCQGCMLIAVLEL